LQDGEGLRQAARRGQPGGEAPRRTGGSGVRTGTTPSTLARHARRRAIPEQESRASRLLLIANDREQQSRRAAGIN
jgi:hypothetical protein